MRVTRSVKMPAETLANERFAHCMFCGEEIRHSGEDRDVWRHVYTPGYSASHQYYTYCKETSMTLAEPEFFQVRLV